MKLKKILALLLAAMVVLGMTSAMAAIGNDSSSEVGVQEGDNSNIVVIPQVVVITNNEGSTAVGKIVAYPQMSFTYSIEGATIADGTYVQDNTIEDLEHPTGPAAKVAVKTGPAGGLTVTPATIAAGTVTLNANGQEAVVANHTFTGVISAFNAAGIYRYKITNTSTTDATNKVALENAGVVAPATVDQEYFLDVYVKNVADPAPATTTHLEFGGFVLTNENTTEISAKENKGMTAKKSGFDDVTLITDTTTNTIKLDPATPADLTTNYSYTTYNITLDKDIKGSLGDTKHGFPFTVTVGVQTGHPDLNYDYEVTGNENTANDVSLVSQTKITAVIPLSNGGSLKIWGLSPFATILYSEKNDTESTYKTKIGNTAGADDVKTEADLNAKGELAAWDAAKNVATGYAITTTATLNTDADQIHYTNTLNDISPTNVALRFGPYLVMFAAGAALFLILLAKRREEDKEEN